MFPDVEIVRQVQHELDKVVEEGVEDLVKLLKNSETPVSNRWTTDEEKLESKSRIVKRLRESWTHDDSSLAKAEEKPSENINFKDAKLNLGSLEVALEEVTPGKKKKRKKGKLAARLLEQGIVTPEMMKQLAREMKEEP